VIVPACLFAKLESAGESLALVNPLGCSCGRANSGERPRWVPRSAPLRSTAPVHGSGTPCPRGGRRPAPRPCAKGLTARRDALCRPPPRLRVARPFAPAAARRALRLPGAGLTVRAGRIERLWKFVKKKVLYCKHYSDFGQFKQAISDCLSQTSTTHAKELDSLLTLKFQVFRKCQIVPI
jgi:hypothetical protein